MSRFLLIIFLTSLSSLALLAQGNQGRTNSGATPRTSITPKTNLSPTTTNTNRNTQNAAADNRGTNSNNTHGNTGRGSTQSRSSRPTEATKTRPSTYAPPTTAKGGRTGKGTDNQVSPLKPAERGVVNWMTIEQALEKSKVEKKKIFVDMYTDWCGWCKHMDSTTFVDANVARYLNEHFYPVKFNAEQEKDIVFKDKTYRFKKSGTRGHHELAAFWLNNRLSFPTVVFLDESQQLIQPVPGYQDADKMEAIINYFGSDSHKRTPWESYEKNFSTQKLQE